MKKLLIILGILIVLVTAGTMIAWWWLTDTRGGAQWALNRAVPHLDRLEWESADGGLASGLALRGVVLEQAGARVEVEQLDVAARIRLLGGIAVQVEQVHARRVRVYLPEAEPPDPDLPPDPFDPARLASPIAVDVRDLLIEDARVYPHDAEPIVVERLGLAGHYSDRIELERLEWISPHGRLQADGRWSLASPFSVDLDLAAVVPIDEHTDQALDLEIAGPLNSLEVAIQSRGPAETTGQARVRGLPELPSGSLGLEGRLANWPGLDLVLDDLSLNAEGEAEDWSLVLDTRLSGMDLPPGRWQLAADGDLRRLNVDALRGEVLEGEVLASGWLDHGGDALAASADIELHGLDFTTLYPEWPQQARVNGEFTARVDGEEIHLDRLKLSAPPTTLTLSGSGRFVPAADELALELDWQDLAWPPLIDEGEPIIASESGRLRLTGRISDWRLELDALLTAPDLPAGQLDVQATGDAHQADIEHLELDLAEAGNLRAGGALGWDPAFEARFDVTLHRFDPGRFVAQLPGRIDASLSVSARHDERWLVGLNLAELEGELRDRPLSGSGRIELADELPQAGRLDVRLGDNRLEFSSPDGERWQWQIDAEALNQLWPGLAGAVALSGELEPYRHRLSASGEAQAAGFGEMSVAHARLELDLDWGEEPRVQSTLSMSDLDLTPWDRIDLLELEFTGDCDDHQVALNLSGQRGDLDLAGHGRLAGCLRHTEYWQATIERLYLGETVAGNWQLADALPIRISDERIEAGPGCLTAAGDGIGRLCLEELAVADQGRARVGIHHIPMDLLLLPVDPVFSLTTPLSGQLDAGWDEHGLTSLTGHLELGSGALRGLGEDDDLLAIEMLRMDFVPEGDHGLLVDLVARLEGDSELTSQAHVVDLRDPSNTMINADARLDLPDIGAFNHLVAELDQLGGRLHGQINLAGSIASPSIHGRLGLSGGHLTHAPMGLRVTEIDIDLEGVSDRATIEGRMVSGDGNLNIDGLLEQQPQGWVMRLELEGDRFNFADVDWFRVNASPDIRIEARAEQLEIDGDIHIDRLRAGLPPGAGERVTPSSDVVVLGEVEEEESDLPLRRLYGRLGIHMGDDARLSAAGLQTRLAGGVELLWNGTPEPRGRGTIRLPEGSYRAYGQTLSIRDGEIMFTGHPLDNPRLDIRAIREIFGDPRVETAGVHIRGPAQKPQIVLFTDPPSTDEKALAYVVTGADFDHAAGQAAVNVGFYLFPRLFVSYGFGLFEAGNVLSGRYELSERWGVRVVSGERDTGIDLGFITDR